MNFAKVEKKGGGTINREGAFIRINTVSMFIFFRKVVTVLVYNVHV